MKYQLTINRVEPYTEEEIKEIQRGNYASFNSANVKLSQALFVELAEEEFNAVKKSVLEVIK